MQFSQLSKPIFIAVLVCLYLEALKSYKYFNFNVNLFCNATNGFNIHLPYIYLNHNNASFMLLN